ncbi:MAG: alanine--tRNA ligase-related protein [Candidatus Curtissbacteria bacterium]|nr:alanine--tRNA ligase-related protein [Candidatus Curtissbacteria bacterium]
MTSQELRQKYLKFFEDKGHKIIPSASLVPKEDVELAGTQRVLFTTAGMHPLVPYLLGTSHPEGKRLVNVQKCLRTDDIDQVGDSVHNTFFEMLGNWSLGDYGKVEAISWSYDFLINHLKLDAKRLYISVFAGDDDAPFDQESFDIWRKLGMPEDHIFRYGKKDNWWGPVGPSGPCGPDTEMFYDIKPNDPGSLDPSSNSQRFVEIWNDVFMEYDKQKDGSFKPLAQRNVDTGMGLERMLAVLQNAPSSLGPQFCIAERGPHAMALVRGTVYETDVFLPLMKQIEELSANFQDKSARIVADHLRASVFLISDGVIPSNVERGYILRRLIRRLIRHASLLKIEQDFLEDLTKVVVKTYSDFYPKLEEFQESIITELKKEEAKFKKALAQGIHEFEKIGGDISGRDAFNLYQNYGFPIELTVEMALESNKGVDVPGFEKEFKAHQDLSRKAGEKTKGGMTTQSDRTAKLHTATHLLHQALRDVLGDHAHQTGSHITDVRLRFDFTHDAKMTEDQIKKVEDLVNQKIKDNLPVEKVTMPKAAADEIGAIGLFDDKYGDLVNIYFMGAGNPKDAYSKEFCGGPHADSTGSLGKFKIIKEESAGSGVRRIYATISNPN